MDINGVAAIVTGGGSGLGCAATEMLVRNGAKVTIFDLNAEAGESAAKEIGAAFRPVNVADDEGVAEALEAAESINGPARILVNCAGVAPGVRIVDTKGNPHDLAAYRSAIEVNLVGTFNLLSKFAARGRRDHQHRVGRGV